MNILLLGSGGREHAMACKIAQSPQCSTLFVAPGNAGTAREARCRNAAVDPMDFEALRRFVLEHEVRMVVVGPEAPLVAGVTDFFAQHADLRNVMVIGPGRAGAQLEGSKVFAKRFMQRHGIPTAAYRSFTAAQVEEGVAFLRELKAPYVLKADGLAGGKGVLVVDSLEEAECELRAMLVGGRFGQASACVVVEEFLKGVELSVFVLTDGKHYKILPTAKDYKRVGEGDTGLNTGGMGSVSPVHFADRGFMQKVEERIVAPTVRGLHAEGIKYKGFIFVGLMAVPDAEGVLNPYVIEYNARMGDPETECVFPRIESDVVELFEHVWRGSLQQVPLVISPRAAACVMMVSYGYPGHYETGKVIEGVELVKDCKVFHAGTKEGEDGSLLTAGGRVLCVTAMADAMPMALFNAYQELEKVSWEGCYFRHDIGQDLLKMLI